MKLHVVSYDLNTPGQVYPAIVQRLQALGATRILYSQWMLKSTMTAAQLRDDLQRHIDSNDGLLVIDVTTAQMAWTQLQNEIKTKFALT